MTDERRAKALSDYRKKLLEHRELEAKVKERKLCVDLTTVRLGLRQLDKDYDKSEDDMKALQSIGQTVGELLKQLDEEKFIVKASSGPRYVVGCRSKVDRNKLKPGARVALDILTLTIMRVLPREVDPLVYNMTTEDPGNVSFSGIGGLTDQIRELREVIELPLINPELFVRVGIKPPKGVLLYGPPGTGKTLLARAVASTLDCNFLKVVSSAIVDKYIGESARIIREMFGYAREHEPCIIFMDEIDAIGARRFSEGTSSDREVQRTLMELLNQMDGFDYLGKTKIIMATNRPDTLDPALLRPGRLDRKIEIPLPNEQGRLDVLKIHASTITKHGDIDYDAIVKLSEGFNGADLRNVCTEAGMFAIRDERDFVIQDDFMKAVRKVGDSKKLESKIDYEKEQKMTNKCNLPNPIDQPLLNTPAFLRSHSRLMSERPEMQMHVINQEISARLLHEDPQVILEEEGEDETRETTPHQVLGESVFNYPPTQPSFARVPHSPIKTAVVNVPVGTDQHDMRHVQVHLESSSSPGHGPHIRKASEVAISPSNSLLKTFAIQTKADALPRQWNTGQELEGVVTMMGIKKKQNPIDKTIFLGCLSGVWIVFAGLFAVSVTGAIPADMRKAIPFLPKIFVALTFPVGIIFILLFGGELFTGNTMIMVVAWLNKKVSLKDLVLNWTTAFFANTASVLLFTWLLGYVTEIYSTEPWLSYVREIATKKATLPVYKCIIMGIPANALVCLAFFLGLAARDVTGKILGLYIPIATFAACGWEHCIANIFYIGLGWMYGADITFGEVCRNIFTVAIGNIIGGSFLVGMSEYYLYHWHADFEPTKHVGKLIPKKFTKEPKAEGAKETPSNIDLEKGAKNH